MPRPIIGLALGGGGARGAAHVGALTVLHQHKIPIHQIAGTSAGAVVGAMYAATLDPKWVKKRFREFIKSDLLEDWGRIVFQISQPRQVQLLIRLLKS